MPSSGYYKNIDGVDYDRKLLEKAQRLAKANGGRLDLAAVEKLWKHVRADGRDRRHADGVWPVELRTMEYIGNELELDSKAMALMKKEVSNSAGVGSVGSGASAAGKRGAATARGTSAPAGGKRSKNGGSGNGYYKTINGVDYDRALLELADDLASSDGKLSVASAKKLAEAAQDGNTGVTACETRTLARIAQTYSLSDSAVAVLDGSSSKASPPSSRTRNARGAPPRSGSSGSDSGSKRNGSESGGRSSKSARGYYKQIDGIKYDRALLECADELASANSGVHVVEAVCHVRMVAVSVHSIPIGKLDAEAVERLIEEARDGPDGVTACEAATLAFIAETYSLSPSSKKALSKEATAAGGSAKGARSTRGASASTAKSGSKRSATSASAIGSSKQSKPSAGSTPGSSRAARVAARAAALEDGEDYYDEEVEYPPGTADTGAEDSSAPAGYFSPFFRRSPATSTKAAPSTSSSSYFSSFRRSPADTTSTEAVPSEVAPSTSSSSYFSSFRRSPAATSSEAVPATSSSYFSFRRSPAATTDEAAPAADTASSFLPSFFRRNVAPAEATLGEAEDADYVPPSAEAEAEAEAEVERDLLMSDVDYTAFADSAEDAEEEDGEEDEEGGGEGVGDLGVGSADRGLTFGGDEPETPNRQGSGERENRLRLLSAGGDSYYKQIDGVSYDRSLLKLAEGLSAGGIINSAAAERLVGEATEGTQITEVEARTLRYIAETNNLTADAAAILSDAQPAPPPTPEPTADYAYDGSASSWQKAKDMIPSFPNLFSRRTAAAA